MISAVITSSLWVRYTIFICLLIWKRMTMTIVVTLSLVSAQSLILKFTTAERRQTMENYSGVLIRMSSPKIILKIQNISRLFGQLRYWHLFDFSVLAEKASLLFFAWFVRYEMQYSPFWLLTGTGTQEVLRPRDSVLDRLWDVLEKNAVSEIFCYETVRKWKIC